MTSRALVALTWWLLACGGAPPPPTVDPDSLRRLAAGDVVGFVGADGSHAWRGIPYAEPPVGELRWRAPRPAPRWQGTLEALATGGACPQFAGALGGSGRKATGIVGGEDCLYLDVYAPRFAPEAVPTAGERLPVMLWIHGGATMGRAGMWDGGKLAATQDVVVVAISYRLGAFGWFHHASLRGEDATPAERSGSFGQLDQLRALAWVQENVAGFGGDPANVTIFGEGFGAVSVMDLVLSPLAQGLIHRAIVQSHPGFGQTSRAKAEQRANEILASLEARAGTAPSADLTETAAWLRSRSMREILAAHVEDADTHAGGYRFSGPVRDGFVLPDEPPPESLARGAYNRVPIILGTTRDEQKLTQALSPEFVHWRLGIAPHALDPERYEASAEHHANACKASTVDAPAAILSGVQGERVFAYRFDWDEEPRVPFLYDGPRLLGAAHGFVGPFVFAQFDLGPQTAFVFGPGSRAGREALSAQMMSWWAQFAATGSPGRGRRSELPEWVAWDPSRVDAPKYLVLDTPEGGGARMASATFTLEGVIQAALADPRFAGAHERCAALAAWACVPEDRYAALPECQAYPDDN